MTLPLSQWPRAAWTLGRTFGVRGASLRARHEMRRRYGRFRETPGFAVTSPVDTASRLDLAVDTERLRASTIESLALERANRVVAGEHQAYRWTWRPMPLTPSEWLTHPATGHVVSADSPWWRVAHLDPSGGDIKELWEPARFGWAYDLIRGYLLTGDDRYSAAFYDYFAHWVKSSPPFRGVHWSCGQETAIRAAALLYAEANLARAPSSTPARKQQLLDILAHSGERIRDAIGYAISQRNNHAISEATGLILLGVRLADSHPEASEWLRTGKRLLERLIREQFAPDGWYIQHSFTYLRLALDQCVLASRALRAVGAELSPEAVSRLRAATELLWAVIDPATGIVPNHGPNDGAFVHPITLADYRDFRPILTAVSATWKFPFPQNVDVDAETLAWLSLESPKSAPPLGDGLKTGQSGWVAARVGSTAAFLRAGSYTSRPGHLDPLHLDVRLDNREVIVDPGTFAYNAAPPWRNGLAGASVHNGPVVDGREPGVRGPRFLWYLWPEAHLLSAGPDENGYRIEAEIPGIARRTVRVSDGEVLVEDAVLDPSAAEGTVRWLLHPDADPAHVSVQEGRLEAATEASVYGWFSPSYGVRLPSRSVCASWGAQKQRTLRTTIRSLQMSPEPRNAASHNNIGKSSIS